MAKYATGLQMDPNTGEVQSEGGGLVRPEDAGPGRVRNGLSYGGYGATAVVGPDGQVGVDYAKSGRNEAVKRYTGIAEASAKRKAYQADFSAADRDMALAQESRDGQGRAMRTLSSAARGSAPSVATGMGSLMADQSLQQQMQASAGQRGGLAQASAASAAYRQSAVQDAAGAGQIAGVRGGELAAARSSLGGGAGAMRGQDYTQQGMMQQRQLTLAEAEMQQRQLNQQTSMGFEGLAAGVRQAERDARMKQDETDAGIFANNLKLEDAEKNRDLSLIGAGVSTGGSLFAGLGRGGGGGGGGGTRPANGGGIIRTNPYGTDY